MTEEEKLLYLEQKRLAEEEMKKKKEDMLTQFLKVSLLKMLVYVLCGIWLSQDLTDIHVSYFTRTNLPRKRKAPSLIWTSFRTSGGWSWERVRFDHLWPQLPLPNNSLNTSCFTLPPSSTSLLPLPIIFDWIFAWLFCIVINRQKSRVKERYRNPEPDIWASNRQKRSNNQVTSEGHRRSRGTVSDGPEEQCTKRGQTYR